MKTLGDLTNLIARNAENIERAVEAIDRGKRAAESLPKLMRDQEAMIEELKEAMEVDA